MAPSAELVGLDLTSSFLPVSAEGNIRYGVANVCDAPAPELVEAFDLTHLRYVLVGCGPVGLDTPIGNLAGKPPCQSLLNHVHKQRVKSFKLNRSSNPRAGGVVTSPRAGCYLERDHTRSSIPRFA